MKHVRDQRRSQSVVPVGVIRRSPGADAFRCWSVRAPITRSRDQSCSIQTSHASTPKVMMTSESVRANDKMAVTPDETEPRAAARRFKGPIARDAKPDARDAGRAINAAASHGFRCALLDFRTWIPCGICARRTTVLPAFATSESRQRRSNWAFDGRLLTALGNPRIEETLGLQAREMPA
jgi:hypothetical protein